MYTCIWTCIRLHNFCIDERIAEETVFRHGLGHVQPGRWELAPLFDKHGATAARISCGHAHGMTPCHPHVRARSHVISYYRINCLLSWHGATSARRTAAPPRNLKFDAVTASILRF